MVPGYAIDLPPGNLHCGDAAVAARVRSLGASAPEADNKFGRPSQWGQMSGLVLPATEELISRRRTSRGRNKRRFYSFWCGCPGAGLRPRDLSLRS